MTSNPFDFSDMTDLPDDIQKSVSLSTGASVRGRYLTLLAQAGRPVTCGELRGAYFRVHGQNVKTSAINSHLQALIKDGAITRPKRGHYTITPAANQVAAE